MCVCVCVCVCLCVCVLYVCVCVCVLCGVGWLPVVQVICCSTEMSVLLLYQNNDIYHLQRSCKGYVFTPVCLSKGGSASVHAGIPPPEHAPPRSRQLPGGGTPWSRHTPSLGAGTPPPWEQAPPHQEQHPPADGYCCRWYASYWNTFL